MSESKSVTYSAVQATDKIEEAQYHAYLRQRRLTRDTTGYLVTKRAFDLLSSFCVSTLLLIPMLMIAVLIMRKDPGNPFYVQKRIGKNGKPLNLVKFRSMRKGADQLENMLTQEQLEQYKREYKLNDDPRLIGYEKPGDGDSCFGAFLRRTSIDEIPQIFFNILLRGDMSVVGPRPILEDELESNYSREQQRSLLAVKPGLTGYWQAYARNNASYESGKRQDMELFYAENANLLWDMKIIFASVASVLCERGAR